METVLLIGAVVIAALAAAPSYRNAREALLIERTAWILEDLNAAIASNATNAPAAEWPRGVVPGSFAYDGTNGASVAVLLRGGARRVTAAASEALR